MLPDGADRNPMALVQALARPNVAGVVRPTVDGMTPDDPRYKSKIPPPEPMSAIELQHLEEEKKRQEALARVGSNPSSGIAGEPPGASSPLAYRLLVTISRLDGALMLSLESAPDWDEVETWTMTVESARYVAKLARALGVKIRDLSGGELGVRNARLSVDQGPTFQVTDPDGSRVDARDVSDVQWARADHASKSLARPDPSGEAGIRPLDPEQTVQFLEDARRRYEEELARESTGEGEPNSGEDPGGSRDDREDALRRRLGLPTRDSRSGEVRGDPWRPDAAPPGPDPVADGETPAQPE